MKAVSKYVPSEGRLDVLESPYMNYRTTSNKAFDEMFRKFIYKLSTKDAEYGTLEERGTSREILEAIIKEVEEVLNDLISKITTEEEKESFVDAMEKIRFCGDFGSELYDRCNVAKLTESIKNEEKKDYYNLISRVQYLIIKGNQLLNNDKFNDFEIVIDDIALSLEKLESYVKNQDYPIDEIRKYQSKLDALSKSMREKIKEDNISDSYEKCIASMTNEKLKFECEKISSLLLCLEPNSELDDLYNLVFRALTTIENQSDFDAFISYMKEVGTSGELGERLYNSNILDLNNLTYEKIKNVKDVSKDVDKKDNDMPLNNAETIDEIAQTVAAAVVMCEEEKTIETLDALLDLLYENKEKANIMYLKNKDSKIDEYCKILDDLIKKYEIEKEQFQIARQNY